MAETLGSIHSGKLGLPRRIASEPLLMLFPNLLKIFVDFKPGARHLASSFPTVNTDTILAALYREARQQERPGLR